MLNKSIFVIDKQIFSNIFTLFKGSVLGTIIMMCSQPIITRLYTPEELGFFALIFSIVTMFSPVINGQYDLLIVSAKSEKEADTFAVISVIVGLLLVTFIALGLIVIQFSKFKVFEDVGWWILSSCILLIVFGINNILVSYNNRHLRYKLISKVNIIRNFGRSLFQILFGLVGFGNLGVLAGNFIGFLMGMKKQSDFLRGQLHRFYKVKKNEVLKLMKNNYKQPVFSAPGVFFSSSANSLIALFVGSLYGIEQLGYYSIAILILNAPLSMFSSNIGKVFYRTATKEKNDRGQFKNSLNKFSIILILIAVPLFVILFFTIIPITELVLGEGWGIVGLFVIFQIPMFSARFIVMSLNTSFIINGKQHIKLTLQSLFFFFTILSGLLASILELDINSFLIITSFLVAGVYILMYVYIYIDSKRTVI